MIMGKKGLVLVAGGDTRELILLKGLLRAGYQVWAFGLPWEKLPEGVVYCNDLPSALSKAAALILPMPGINNEGQLYAPLASMDTLPKDIWRNLPPQTPVLTGVASNYLRALTEEQAWQLFETANMDRIAIPNAIPTAEGAIQLVMEELSVTIYGCPMLILGYGRVGEALAKRLAALGALLKVVNRGAERRELAEAHGFDVAEFIDLPRLATRTKVIFNTVPAMVLPATILKRLPSDALVVDLASQPGGTDFLAAQSLGVRAILAGGLPGKVAPESAGKVLAENYPILLDEIFAAEN